ncbi:MAG: helix-turn-helix transcriptional regulator [Dehalococcoidia bacterium]
MTTRTVRTDRRWADVAIVRAAAAEAWSGADTAMQASREQILNHLHQHGQATVKDLAQLVGLTPTGVRQHLSVLEREGLLEAREVRGHVGRPAYVYSLTDRAEALYPKNYAMLTNLLLEEVRTMVGAEALQRLLRRVSARMAEQYQDRVDGKPLGERVEATASVLRELGCEVNVGQQNDLYFINQCTCPYPKVARSHSAVCALEVDFVQRMTGTDARLVSSLLRGDSACSYRIRPAEAPPSRVSEPSSKLPAPADRG